MPQACALCMYMYIYVHVGYSVSVASGILQNQCYVLWNVTFGLTINRSFLNSKLTVTLLSSQPLCFEAT